MRISYNSPVILNFSLVAAVISIINFVTRSPNTYGLLDPFTSLGGTFHFDYLPNYFGFFLYPFNHADFTHLIGNLTFILLLGPILEEKYGARKLTEVMLLTIITTGVLNIFLFSTGIIGASGIVFTLIILISITNRQRGKLPLTFIIIFLLYVGKEVYMGLFEDQISQFGHIMGGIVGSIYGLKMNKDHSVKTKNP